MKFAKNTVWWFAGATGAAATTFAVSWRLFNYAFLRINYVPPTDDDKQKYSARYDDDVAWLKAQKLEQWQQRQVKATGEAVALFLRQPHGTNQTVVIAHGYRGNGTTMASYAKMFYELGFNVLLPDNRAHGKSAGKYVTFGWLDRLDYASWVDRVIEECGDDSKIGLFGVSMGAATMCLLSGEYLPRQVKWIISDCAYSTVRGELTYLLHRQFHLPTFPIYQLVSRINAAKVGYKLDDVSVTKQLQKNRLPIFFIHGQKDDFVPCQMVHENFAATNAKKQLWIAPNVGHAETFWRYPSEYKNRIKAFTKQYEQ